MILDRICYIYKDPYYTMVHAAPVIGSNIWKYLTYFNKQYYMSSKLKFPTYDFSNILYDSNGMSRI